MWFPINDELKFKKNKSESAQTLISISSNLWLGSMIMCSLAIPFLGLVYCHWAGSPIKVAVEPVIPWIASAVLHGSTLEPFTDLQINLTFSSLFHRCSTTFLPCLPSLPHTVHTLRLWYAILVLPSPNHTFPLYISIPRISGACQVGIEIQGKEKKKSAVSLSVQSSQEVRKRIVSVGDLSFCGGLAVRVLDVSKDNGIDTTEKTTCLGRPVSNHSAIPPRYVKQFKLLFSSFHLLPSMFFSDLQVLMLVWLQQYVVLRSLLPWLPSSHTHGWWSRTSMWLMDPMLPSLLVYLSRPFH